MHENVKHLGTWLLNCELVQHCVERTMQLHLLINALSNLPLFSIASLTSQTFFFFTIQCSRMHLLWIIIAAWKSETFFVSSITFFGRCEKMAVNRFTICVFILSKAWYFSHPQLLDNFTVIARNILKVYVATRFFSLPAPSTKISRENVQFHSTHNFPKSYKLQKKIFTRRSEFFLDGHTLWHRVLLPPRRLATCEKVKIAFLSAS